jgi:AcrR family transcriptional regulator
VNDKKSSENRIRKSIIELGCRMFLEKGLKDTRVSDITNSLNIGKGSFYFYFSDKRELFLTCIPLIFEKMFATGWEKVKESKNPLERIKIRGRIIMPFLKEFCAIVQLSKEAIQDEDVKIRNLGIDTYQSIRMPVEADIKNGIRQGLFQDMDPRVASTLMLGMIENIYYLKKIEKDVALDELWDNFTKLMMNGICKEQKTISG